MKSLRESQPKNLEECFKFFDENVKDIEEFKNSSEREAVGGCHMFLGRGLRNEWYLWWSEELLAHCKKEGKPYPEEKPELVKYFNDELGVFHADDMSSIILKSYHRKLNGKPLDLEKQAKYYQDFWKKSLEGNIKLSDLNNEE